LFNQSNDINGVAHIIPLNHGFSVVCSFNPMVFLISIFHPARFQKHPSILMTMEKAAMENSPPIEAPAAMVPQARHGSLMGIS
jgi:hypothetical protein